MLSVLSLLLFAATLPLAIAAVVLLVEIASGILTKAGRSPVEFDGQRPRVLVLVPAHNESRGIVATLGDVREQLAPGDCILVVADNCSDDTAELAQSNGARVVARHDLAKRGKGYALDFGLRSLREDDPNIVLIVDADCRLEPGALDRLARTCDATGRPAQALYLMNAPEKSAVNHAITEFAWRIKNDLRPRGLAAFGLPCQLMGSGMAFPRHALARVELASGHLAEDLELGLELARAGCPPVFCPDAVVRSVLPSSEAGSVTQRARWEHGHLAVIGGRFWPSVREAMRDRNWGLFALSLDAAVPPLVLLTVLTTGVTMVSLVYWLLSGAGLAALIVILVGLISLALAFGLAWIACGRNLLTGATLLALACHVKSKAAIYAGAFRPNKSWTRTDRGGPS